jgi:hypothetical protein
MATWDGSGDIGFTKKEFRAIILEMQNALHRSPDDGLLALSVGVNTGHKVAVVNIRPPRHRGPIDNLSFNLRPFGTSNI